MQCDRVAAADAARPGGPPRPGQRGRRARRRTAACPRTRSRIVPGRSAPKGSTPSLRSSASPSIRPAGTRRLRHTHPHTRSSGPTCQGPTSRTARGRSRPPFSYAFGTLASRSAASSAPVPAPSCRDIPWPASAARPWPAAGQPCRVWPASDNRLCARLLVDATPSASNMPGHSVAPVVLGKLAGPARPPHLDEGDVAQRSPVQANVVREDVLRAEQRGDSVHRPHAIVPPELWDMQAGIR